MTLLDEIEAFIPALRRDAHALMRDRDGAEDLVQDCLERAVARRHLWCGDREVRIWLFRILLNRFRNVLRSSRPRLQLLPLEAVGATPQSGSQESHLALREVHAAIGRLPDDQRAVLLLVAVEGMSIDEAARALALPPGTVASRVGRARAALRTMTGHAEGRSPRIQGTRT
ncbi:RNA polymerase sigma factor [Paracoccus aestuariivivens]|uniref:Sigma-70 family RNA polymerase sigma factor n=1 Tax=Paracoccus aestuariivivens TaxID=1820333 RepID=A0A6L6JCG6_9RHOB|nr:sigma-70 family RNA polymerase sigma factor [Paracoccus aestuariivivens]MTH79883.1 sigma-70 family RNA polymerase sigma factor [Paracoccus aestuariivivens]